MKNKGLWLSVAVFVVLAVVFAFTDWQISQALYNPEAGWARFMEAYGQIPGAFLGVLSASILLRIYKVEKNVKSIAGVIGVGLLALLTSFGMSADALGAQVNADQISMPLLVGVTVGVVILVQVILRAFPLETVNQYKNAAKAGLILMLVGGILIVWAVKIPWGRWTYRDILEAGNTALFTPWYVLQGNNGHHSFFSGHTAMSFVVLGYLMFLPKGYSMRNPILVVFLLWGVIGGMSRIVAGAHFASDVLFGAGETILLFWILKQKFLKDAV
jgi:membrane-associated phospholipid phosphatase